MEKLEGLHILLTYTCNYECDHCFVWGSPWQTGVLTLSQLDDVFRQAKEIDSIYEIYFEGGEAFLYYPILIQAVKRAKRLGYQVGIVSNGYWATGVEDAWTWLQPLANAGLDRLELSFDSYHGNEPGGNEPGNGNGSGNEPGNGNGSGNEHPAQVAARELFLDADTIVVNPPVGYRDPDEARPGLPLTGGGVMFRGRAAEKLTEGLPLQSWTTFINCPYEDLAMPSRIHLDPLGYLHVCQGVVIGNLFEKPLKEILAEFDPEGHPITGPLLAGGPAKLVVDYDLEHESGYVDACHLCYSTRKTLRHRFPSELCPDQVYGLYG